MSDKEQPETPDGFERVEIDGEHELSKTEKAWLKADPEDYDWITETDKKILSVLMTELTLTPSIIAENIDRARPTVSRRLNMLRAGGLVEKEERGKYAISTRGIGFVEHGMPAGKDQQNSTDN